MRAEARPDHQQLIHPRPARHGISQERVPEEIILGKNAIKRLIEPEEIASLAAWLACEQDTMVTGASYVVDGGWTD